MRSLALFTIIVLVGCQKAIPETEEEYLAWLHKADHGLISVKSLNGFTLTAKFLPTEYLTFNELKGTDYSIRDMDSLSHLYESSYTWLLTIAPDENWGNRKDVMYHDIYSSQEFKERVHTMNFDISSMVKLRTDKGIYRPVLHTLENTYSLGNHRTIYLVFADTQTQATLSQATTYDLIFEDLIFETGISHFRFDRENMQQIPPITFWSI